MAQQHTTLPNSSLKILQHYCGKTTDFIKKITHLSINSEEETLVSFDVSALSTSIPVPAALQVINSKMSTCTNFTNICKIPTEKFIRLLEFTLTNCISCFNTKFYKQLQGAAIGSPASHHCKYLHGILWILSHSHISNINQVVVQVCWWCPKWHQERSSQPTSRATQFHGSTHKIQHRSPRNRVTPLPRYPDQSHSQLHRIHSLQKNPQTQIGTWTTTLTIPFQQNYLLSTLSSIELNK